MADPGAEGLTDRAILAYEASLEKHAMADLRPPLRHLLVRLKKRDPAAYEEAVRRYEEELVRAVAREASEPLTAWISFGMWLAERLEPGRAVMIDASGRAYPVPAPPRPGHLVLHLPTGRGSAALLLAAPRSMSEFQRATAELLVR
ncbi:MAG: hypothetical protein ACE5JR_08890 [Gemmatimonadota bacterium]